MKRKQKKTAFCAGILAAMMLVTTVYAAGGQISVTTPVPQTVQAATKTNAANASSASAKKAAKKAANEETYMGVTMSDPLMNPEIDQNSALDLGGGVTLYKNKKLADSDPLPLVTRSKSYTQIEGVDVSRWQVHLDGNGVPTDSIDWKKVKKAGYTFAIVKAAGTYTTPEFEMYEDPAFRQNITGAAKAGLRVGAYFFSQALTTDEAKKEAKYFTDLLNDCGVKLTLPAFMDYEWTASYRLANGGDSTTRTAVIMKFMKRVNALGYCAGFYSSDYTISAYMNGTKIAKYGRMWVARYSDLPPQYYRGAVDLWQYSSSGGIDGVPSTNIDKNHWYDDGTITGSPENGTMIGTSEDEVATFRLYDPKTGRHYYTKTATKRDTLIGRGWEYEGIAWRTPKAKGREVYYLVNDATGDMWFTKDTAQAERLTKKGWTYKGKFSNSYAKKNHTPVYRMENPYANGAGKYLYTKSEAEREVLLAFGWKQGGIKFYVN